MQGHGVDKLVIIGNHLALTTNHWNPVVKYHCMPLKMKYVHLFYCLLAPKPGYSQGVTSYTQSQQTRQVTVIKPAAPSPASSTFSIYPVTSTVQPVAAAASVVPSYSQSPTYSTNAVTYSGEFESELSDAIFSSFIHFQLEAFLKPMIWVMQTQFCLSIIPKWCK